METPDFEDAAPFSCPPSLSLFVVHSPEALLVIHKDRPFEAVEAKVGADLDTFTEVDFLRRARSLQFQSISDCGLGHLIL